MWIVMTIRAEPASLRATTPADRPHLRGRQRKLRKSVDFATHAQASSYQKPLWLTRWEFRSEADCDSLGAGGFAPWRQRLLCGRISRRPICGVAAASKNANQSRRLLSLAAVRDGMNRTEAARIGGKDRQTLRDWVHRFNTKGRTGFWTSHRMARAPG
ncbi:hypothetical protein CCR97_27205 [Rhodoplanes elegans]|nr:hypothetical protein [Rhodoplanes elegans]